MPDHRDVFGCTSLHLAAHNCHEEALALKAWKLY